MTNIVNTGNASVDALAEMNISGNVTPVNWYKTILRENGKLYLLAICVLSEIVYWYRPVEIRDEHSGMTIGYRKKFREDLLQKTYNDFAEQFGVRWSMCWNAFATILQRYATYEAICSRHCIMLR